MLKMSKKNFVFSCGNLTFLCAILFIPNAANFDA